MNSDTSRPSFGRPTGEYSQVYMDDLIRELERVFAQMLSPGWVRASQVNISQLPTASAGLRSGDLWNDSGTVKVV